MGASTSGWGALICFSQGFHVGCSRGCQRGAFSGIRMLLRCAAHVPARGASCPSDFVLITIVAYPCISFCALDPAMCHRRMVGEVGDTAGCPVWPCMCVHVADQLAGTVHVMRAAEVHTRAHVSQKSRLWRTWLLPAIFWSSVPTNVVERGRRHLCPNRDDCMRCKFVYGLRSSSQRRTRLCAPGQWICTLVWQRWTPRGPVRPSGGQLRIHAYDWTEILRVGCMCMCMCKGVLA